MNSEDNSENNQVSGQPIREDRRKPFYRRPLSVVFLVCIAIILILGVGWYWLVSLQYVSTENAFLEGHLVQVAPQVSGPVAEVRVEENAHVEKGELLVRLDPTDYKVALQQARTRLAKAKADLDQAHTQLSVARAGVAQAKAKVEVAKSRAEDAEGDFQRYQKIEGAISQQKIENSKHRVEQTQAELKSARQRVDSEKAQIAAAKAGIAAAKAAVEQAQAGVKQAQLRLSYTKIKAPVSGQLAERGVEAGEYVQPGQSMLTIVPDRIWVKANFKETQITHMQVGQPVEIEIDAYPDRTFHGHVTGIQHATGAEFALLPPQNATGNYIKIVQRVPVKIVFDESPDVYTLAPGMSVVPTVKVLKHPPWPW